MSFQRVKLLDDHIVVLRYLLRVLSEELCVAIEEREELGTRLGIVDSAETDEGRCISSSCLSSSGDSEASSKLKKEQVRDQEESRSFSPTSPLDCCCLPIEYSETFEETDDNCTSKVVCIGGEESITTGSENSGGASSAAAAAAAAVVVIDSGEIPNQMRTKENNGGSCVNIFSEPLPTSRHRASSCQLDTSEIFDLDMNNTFPDSDDDSTPSTPHMTPLALSPIPTETHTLMTVDDDMEHSNSAAAGRRSTSPLNNAEAEDSLEANVSSKPHYWIPNTAFTSGVLHMLRPNEQLFSCGVRPSLSSIEDDGNGDGKVHVHFSNALLSNSGSSRISECSEHPTQQSSSGLGAAPLRSYDSELIERASVAHRLSLELRQKRFELQEREMHIEMLLKNLQYYKQAYKKEASLRKSDMATVREQLDEASTSKFLLFCKLQTAEARLKEMEDSRSSHKWLSSMQVSDDDEDEDSENWPVGVKHEAKVLLFEKNRTINLSLDAQRAVQHNANFTPPPLMTNNSPHQVSKPPVSNHPLQETLSQTYVKLLEAEKRGDQLQRQVWELNGQERMKNEKQKKQKKINTEVVSQQKQNINKEQPITKTKRQGSHQTTKKNERDVNKTPSSTQKTTTSQSSTRSVKGHTLGHTCRSKRCLPQERVVCQSNSVTSPTKQQPKTKPRRWIF